MNKKLEVRDLINVGLFAVLGFIFMLIGSFTAMVPVLMPIVPLVQGILVGPSNMLFSTKIKKPGMLFIQTMLISLAYVIMGHGPWALLTGAIAGFIGEIILKSGSYDSKGKSRLAFSFSSLCTLGNYVPIIISRNTVLKKLVNLHNSVRDRKQLYINGKALFGSHHQVLFYAYLSKFTPKFTPSLLISL